MQAERILDLSFWSAEHSELALGGLWEFHAQKLLEPGERTEPSDLLVEISRPWKDFPGQPDVPVGVLQQASYVMLVKGLQPRPQGYALQVDARQSHLRLIAARKYAPERKQQAENAAFIPVMKHLQSLFREALQLVFQPVTSDEIWMLIMQRWESPNDEAGDIPRLSVAGDTRGDHLESWQWK